MLTMQVRFMDGVRNTALTALPPRWWQEVIEVPILLTALFSFTKLLLIRCVSSVPSVYSPAQCRQDSEDFSGGADRSPNEGYLSDFSLRTALNLSTHWPKLGALYWYRVLVDVSLQQT